MNPMPYMIDGHNLIPKIPGLSLDAVDDETQLIERVQEFCRLRRKQAEIYFDNAPPGMSRARRFGVVTARFIREGTTADQAMRAHLQRLGRSARGWIVVSSDQEVRQAARAARAQWLSSEAFARQLTHSLAESGSGEPQKLEGDLNAEEIDEWLELFSGDQPEDSP